MTIKTPSSRTGYEKPWLSGGGADAADGDIADSPSMAACLLLTSQK